MEDQDPWPFGDDAERSDALTSMRIAVTSSHPRWAYLVAFDRESEARPTDHEAALLASYLAEYIDHWYNESYKAKLARCLLDVDGGANGVTFHKWGPDDWGYRRRSWSQGPTFWPGQPGWYRDRYPVKGGGAPFGLVALMDRIHTIIDKPIQHWLDWKAAHPDVFAEVSA